MEPEHFGPYRLDGLLGRGGMGEVHRAFDTVKRRTVALKRLRRDLAGDTEFERRFRRESEHAARLSDPHVIPIHDYGEIDGVLFIDMRLVQGTDLATLIAEHGPLPARRAVHLVAQVGAALDAAHADGLVHRDVKPSNALTTGEEHDDFVYLVDFGIVRSVAPGTTALTGTGSAVGTLDYMAPERFTDEPDDHRVDVYALGCVLYELLTGSRPFPQQSFAALLNAHVNVAPPRVTAARPELPAAFDAVVARAMAKRPADRFASAGDLARAARAALTARAPAVRRPPAPVPPAPDRPRSSGPRTIPGLALPAPPPPAAPKASARPARRPSVAVLSALAAVVLLLGGGAIARTWVNSQYFVGASGDNVAIFQGVRGSVLGLALNEVAEVSDIALTDLPESTRGTVRTGLLVSEGGLDGARTRVEMLRASLLAPCSALSTPTASPADPPAPGGDTTPLPTVAPEPGLNCRPVS